MVEEYNLSFLNLQSIENTLLNIQADTHGLLTSGISSFNVGMPVFIHPQLKGLYAIIKQYVRLYCIKYDIPTLKFINSWFNITYPESELKIHNHGETGLSGAFYVSVGEKSVPLIFPHTQIQPYSGLLIIFSKFFRPLYRKGTRTKSCD